MQKESAKIFELRKLLWAIMNSYELWKNDWLCCKAEVSMEWPGVLKFHLFYSL